MALHQASVRGGTLYKQLKMSFGYDPRSIKRSSDTKVIIAKFMLAEGEERQIKLINVYKGVPISHEGTVVKVINDRITIKFHVGQSLLLNLEGQTYILSKLFPKPIKAAVMTINTNDQIAILTNFSFSDPDFRKREHIRVELDYDDAPTVVIGASDSNVRLFGKLNDISLYGVGVVVIALQDIIKRSFSENAEVELTFSLPFKDKGEPLKFNLWGKIRHIDRSQENFKLGIQTFPTQKMLPYLQKFISQRQAEILEEIENYTQSLNLGNWIFPA